MTTITLRDTGVTDTHIQKNTPTTNFGTAQSFYVSASTSANIWRGLIKFAGIAPPGGVVAVSSAVLTLRNRDVAASTRVLQVRRLLSAWDELQATYNSRLTGTPWNVAGVIGGTDVDATVIATGTMPTTSETSFNVTGAGLNQYVQDVMNGLIPDYGLILTAIDDSTVFDGVDRRIGSRDNATAVNRPTLVVTFTTTLPPDGVISNWSGTSLSGNGQFTVTLNRAAPVGGCSVDYDVAAGTAIEGVDFNRVTGALNFAEGEITKVVSVPLIP